MNEETLKLRLRGLKKALANCDSRIEDKVLREETMKKIRLRIAEIEGLLNGDSL